MSQIAVKIRLSRVGARKKPFYRLVAADSRAPRDGSFLEIIGYVNPLVEPADIVVNEEKALKWLRHGAQPSDTAASLLRKVGILQKVKESVSPSLQDEALKGDA